MDIDQTLFPTEDESFFADLYETQEEPPVPFVGIRNLGNSCFFNSVLQVLFYCPKFQFFLEKLGENVRKTLPNDDFIPSSLESEDKISESDKNKCKLFLSLRDLFLKMRQKQSYVAEKLVKGETTSPAAVEPRSLLDVLRLAYPDFEPYTQQDAQECLRCILDALHDAIMLSEKGNTVSHTSKQPTVGLLGGSKISGCMLDTKGFEIMTKNDELGSKLCKIQIGAAAGSIGHRVANLSEHAVASSLGCNVVDISEHSSASSMGHHVTGFTKQAVSSSISGNNLQEPLKVLGGGKQGETSITFNTTKKLGTENSDPLRRESKTTSSRKRGIKALFRNPLKRSGQHENTTTNEKCNKFLPLTEKSDFNNIRINVKRGPIPSPKIVKKRKISVALSSNNDASEVPKGLVGRYALTESPKDVFDISQPVVVLPDIALKTNFFKRPDLEIREKFEVTLEPGKSFIDSLFQGELINEIRCMECESSVNRVEKFMDISLPVQKEKKESILDPFDGTICETTCAPNEIKCTVSWGLNSFTSREIMEGENKYYCEKCWSYTEGQRRLLLHDLPPILTLHLKRFSSDESGLKGGLNFTTGVLKINTCFDIPLELSLDQWCSSSCKNDVKYKLFGIIVHSGSTVSSGHYLAYVKYINSLISVRDTRDLNSDKIREYDGHWFEADDEVVKEVSDEKLQEVISPDSTEGTTRTPYLLFYYRDG